MAGLEVEVLRENTLEEVEKLAKEKITDENRPDAVIFDFNELKEIFPEAPHVAWDKVRRV